MRTHALLLALLALALAGCSPLIGLLARAASSGTGVIVEGQRVSGSTSGASDTWRPSCGAPDGGGDRAYTFVPQRTGVHRVDLEASYDCVVAIFDDEGQPIACNDDDDRTSHSRVEHRLEAGRRYTIVVDGYRGATGTFTLTVEALSSEGPTPPRASRVLRVGEVAQGDTSAASDRRTPPCGSAPGSPDETWTFTPEESGRYDIEVRSSYDGVLAVYEPGGQEPVACNDDDGSTRVSRVVVALRAGVPYEVVVDGYHGASGTYELRVAPPAVAAPARPLPLGQPVAGDTRGQTDVRTPACGSRPGSPDQSWLFTPPRDGAYVLHVDAEYDSVLAVFEGETMIGCNDDFQTTRASRLQVQLRAGTAYEVVLDGFGGQSGAYVLQATEIPAGGGSASLQLGVPVAGNTAVGSDTRTPSCGARPGSPDQTWTFVAPADGVYRVVVDAEYDSLLAVESAGQELACNDDDGSTRRSRVEVQLSAGQRVDIVVDGFQGQQGNYRLVVMPVAAVSATGENIDRLEQRCAGAPRLAPGRTLGTIAASRADARTSCSGSPGGDVVYRIEVTQPSIVRVRADSPLEPVLELREGCSRGHTVVACAAPTGTPRRASLEARVVPGRSYVLVVDTRRPGDDGVTLDVRVLPGPGAP